MARGMFRLRFVGGAAVAALVLAAAAWTSVESGRLAQVVGAVGVFGATAVLVGAVFPVRALARALRVVVAPRGVAKAYEIERALHVLIVVGTALVGLSGVYFIVRVVVDVVQGRRWTVAIVAALLVPLLAAVARLAIVEPLKVRLSRRLVSARQQEV